MLADDERFGGSRKAGGGDVVVERLHRMARTERAGSEEPLAHVAQDRLNALDGSVVGGADHDGERAGFGPRHAAGNRRVDQRDAAPAEFGAQLARALGLRRAHIDNDRALRQGASQRATIGLQQHVTDDRPGRQHGDDDVHGASQFGKADRDRAVVIARETRRLRGIGIEDRQRNAGARQIGRHRTAHIADADKADVHCLRHLSAFPGRVSSCARITHQTTGRSKRRGQRR